MPYDETVPCSRWFARAMLVSALLTFAGGAWLLLASSPPWAGLAALAAAPPLFAAVAVFGALRIEVDARALRARFGPFGPTLPGDAIAAARAEPYRWLPHGGWGLRRGRLGGRTSRACSVPFLRTGVAVETRNGQRYYLSSRRPDELAAAVNRLANAAGRP